MSQKGSLLESGNDDKSIEISDDIEVVGPGKMLSEARISIGMSQQQVADKLNFRVTLVQNIETECFDKSLPDTFNRGYLRNYAKLVNVSQEQVLVSYEQLDVAQKNCAELQSFSKGTEKRAEHNRVMWVTYLILAVLVGATLVWWMQTPSSQPINLSEINSPVKVVVNQGGANDNNQTDFSQINPDSADQSNAKVVEMSGNILTIADEVVKTTPESELLAGVAEQVIDQGNANLTAIAEQAKVESQLTVAELDSPDLITALAKVVFTFSGDCWVNIYDASGERLAWGVKKSGYVMTISGQAPFSVTLGKPELVTIDYNDVRVDTSTFSVGNIAKFALPIKP
jgi:cytoskeleton protein RodZ